VLPLSSLACAWDSDALLDEGAKTDALLEEGAKTELNSHTIGLPYLKTKPHNKN